MDGEGNVVQDERVDVVIPLQHLKDGLLPGLEVAPEDSMLDLETQFRLEEVSWPTLLIKLQFLRPSLDTLKS